MIKSRSSDVAQIRLRHEADIARGCEINIDGRRCGTALAMAKHHYGSQALLQMLSGVVHASKNIVAQSVSRNAHNKEVVRPFRKQQFDGNTGIRAPDDRCKGCLPGHNISTGAKPHITDVDVDAKSGGGRL